MPGAESLEPTAIPPDGTLYYECHMCGETLDPRAQRGLRWAWPSKHFDQRILVCDDCWEEYPLVYGVDEDQAMCEPFDTFRPRRARADST